MVCRKRWIQEGRFWCDKDHDGRKKRRDAQCCSEKEVVKPRQTASLVGAGGLDVAGLLALVADTVVADLSGAVAGKVADLATYKS